MFFFFYIKIIKKYKKKKKKKKNNLFSHIYKIERNNIKFKVIYMGKGVYNRKKERKKENKKRKKN